MTTVRTALCCSLAVAWAALGCRSSNALTAQPLHNEVTTQLPPLEEDRSITELPVPERGKAVVVVPLGATQPRPILVAAHGMNDAPEPLCAMWQTIVQTRAFVLCPRGVPNGKGSYTYDSHQALYDEIRAGLDALQARYPRYIASGPVVYSGFSLGSYQGVNVVAKDPELMPRVVLIEGGQDPWNQQTVESFATRGGRRVLFVTGQAPNFTKSKQASSELETAGIETKIAHAEGAGHVFTGPVAEALAKEFSWVVRDDPRWTTD